MLRQLTIETRLAQLGAVVGLSSWLVALARLGGVPWADLHGLALGMLGATALLTVPPVGRLGGLRGVILALIGAGLGVGVLLLPRGHSDGLVLPLALWASFLVTAELAGRSRRWAWGIAAVVALVGGLEAVLGWCQYFGLAPTPGGHDHLATGTFYNRNHFAGLLILSLPLALVHALEPRPSTGASTRQSNRYRARVLLGLVAAGAIVTAALFSRSRAGILITAATGVVCLVLVAWRSSGAPVPGRRRVSRTRLAALWMVLAVGLVVGGVLARQGVAHRLERPVSQEQRWVVWADTLRLIADHPIGGVGPGGYRDHIRRYQSLPSRVNYVHAHNDFLETAAEWGVPLTLLFWGWVARLLLRTLRLARRRRDLLAAGTGAAMVGLLLHSLVDFNLYIPANAVLFFGLLGTSQALGRGESSPDAPALRSGWSAVTALAVFSSCLVTAAVLIPRWTGARALANAESAEALREVVATDPENAEARFRLGKVLLGSLDEGDRREAVDEFRLALELAPIRWEYRLEAARAFEAAGDAAGAETIFRRALDINPSAAGFHWQWSNFLVRQGRLDEAVAAAERAVDLEPDLAGAAFTLLVRAGTAPDSLQAIWQRRAAAAQSIARGLVEADPSRLAELLDTGSLLSIGRTAFAPGSDFEPGVAHGLTMMILQRGDAHGARSLWEQINGTAGWSAPDDMIWNGTFALPLAEGGLGWSTSRESATAVQRRPSEPSASSTLQLRPVLLSGRSNWLRQQLAVVHPGAVRLSVVVDESVLDEGAAIVFDILDARSREPLASLSIGNGETGLHAVSFVIPEATPSATLRLRRIGEREAPAESSFVIDSIALRPVSIEE